MSQPYYFPSPAPEFHHPTVVHQLPKPEPSELAAGRVMIHLLLLGLTIVTTMGIGSLLFWDGSLAAPGLGVACGAGALFSFTLLVILGAHEMGHYIACRWYGVRATLPYFIPAPIGAGTFGAFIKIKSPIPSKRALFDIGIAGPLAGFVFAIPAALVALYFAASLPPTPLNGELPIFQDPPLFVLLAWLFHLPRNLEINPIWFAAWIGLIMTSLNLLPVGQLDGGHVIYAVFGWRGHRFIARAIYVSVLALAVYSYLRHGWFGWFIYAVILTLMLRIGHPPVMDEYEPLGLARKLVAVIGLIVFLLCFMPFPITY